MNKRFKMLRFIHMKDVLDVLCLKVFIHTHVILLLHNKIYKISQCTMTYMFLHNTNLLYQIHDAHILFNLYALVLCPQHTYHNERNLCISTNVENTIGTYIF